MRYAEVDDLILAQHVRSVQLHGAWNDYTPEMMITVIVNELAELIDAAERGDIHGEHGMIAELAQVAACCKKAMMVLVLVP